MLRHYRSYKCRWNPTKASRMGYAHVVYAQLKGGLTGVKGRHIGKKQARGGKA